MLGQPAVTNRNVSETWLHQNSITQIGRHQQAETQIAYSKPNYFFFFARIAE